VSKTSWAAVEASKNIPKRQRSVTVPRDREQACSNSSKEIKLCAALGFGKEGAASKRACWRPLPPTHRARHGEAAARCAPHSPRGARLTRVVSGRQGEERWPGRGFYREPHRFGPQERAEQPCGNPRTPRSAPEALSSIAAPAGVQHCRGRPSTPCPQAGAGLPAEAGAGFRAHPGSRSPCYGRFARLDKQRGHDMSKTGDKNEDEIAHMGTRI
jgi:hypothetical protein